MRQLKNILVTGGCGFIGSNFIHYVFQHTEFEGRIINVDKLTYAANPEYLEEIKSQFSSRYIFIKEDICETKQIQNILETYQIDCVVNFAAETHVDNSIASADSFIKTNIFGTFSLLEACKKVWGDRKDVLFHQISTDEVYGALQQNDPPFVESTQYNPKNPYSASKTAADHLVKSYYNTYGLPVTVSYCSNNYGPNQYQEKLIPLTIKKILSNQTIPVYGTGKNIRDWIFVEDHCSAAYSIITKAKEGNYFNIGGDAEVENLTLVTRICEIVANHQGLDKDHYTKLISFVKDRLGHDFRYAMNFAKIEYELGWSPTIPLHDGLIETVEWYMKKYENMVK
jgi:dTDP-glucose 4,6-dehydratase